MFQKNPEICSLINEPCSNQFLCGTCPIARNSLLESADFNDLKKTIQVISFRPDNRTAISYVEVNDSQNNPNRLILATVRNGLYQKLITRIELSRLKKSQ